MKNSNKNSVAFLPGWGFSASVWDDLLGSLGNLNVKKIDLPETLEKNLAEEINSTMLERVSEDSTIVAWSLSGLFAINFCYQFPQMCKKLILINSLPRFSTGDDWMGISEKFSTRFIKQAKNHFDGISNKFLQLVQYPDNSESVKLYLQANHKILPAHQDVLINYLEFLFEANFVYLLEKLNIPIYFLLSEKDAIIPIQSAVQLSKINKNITVKIIPEVGHSSFITHKEIFAKSLMSILHE